MFDCPYCKEKDFLFADYSNDTNRLNKLLSEYFLEYFTNQKTRPCIECNNKVYISYYYDNEVFRDEYIYLTKNYYEKIYDLYSDYLVPDIKEYLHDENMKIRYQDAKYTLNNELISNEGKWNSLRPLIEAYMVHRTGKEINELSKTIKNDKELQQNVKDLLGSLLKNGGNNGAHIKFEKSIISPQLGLMTLEALFIREYKIPKIQEDANIELQKKIDLVQLTLQQKSNKNFKPRDNNNIQDEIPF